MSDTNSKPFNFELAGLKDASNGNDATFKPGSETSDEDQEEYKKKFQVNDEIDEDFRAEADEIKNMLAEFNSTLIAVKNRPDNIIHELEEIDDIEEEDNKPKTLVDLVMQQSKSPYKKQPNSLAPLQDDRALRETGTKSNFYKPQMNVTKGGFK